MLTDKQITKLLAIMTCYLYGNTAEFYQGVRKLTKLEIVLLLTQTHQVMHIGKSKRIDLENKIITALQTK